MNWLIIGVFFGITNPFHFDWHFSDVFVGCIGSDDDDDEDDDEDDDDDTILRFILLWNILGPYLLTTGLRLFFCYRRAIVVGIRDFAKALALTFNVLRICLIWVRAMLLELSHVVISGYLLIYCICCRLFCMCTCNCDWASVWFILVLRSVKGW